MEPRHRNLELMKIIYAFMLFWSVVFNVEAYYPSWYDMTNYIATNGMGGGTANTVVTNDGRALSFQNPSNSFAGNGSGLVGIQGFETNGTANNAIKATSAFNLNGVPIYSWYRADSFYGQSNGYAPVFWNDATGSPRSLTGNGFTYVQNGINGRSSILMSGSSAVLTNAGFFPLSANTNFCRWIVFQDYNQVSKVSVLWSANQGTTSGFHEFTFSTQSGGGQNNNGNFFVTQTNGFSDGVNIHIGSPNIIGTYWQGGTLQIAADGYVATGSDNAVSGLTGGIGYVGDLYIGNFPGGGFAFNGLISEIITCTNVLSQDQINTVNQYLAQKYSKKQNNYYLLGTSETKGWGASAYSNLLIQIEAQLPAWNVFDLAVGGYQTVQVYNSLQTNSIPLLGTQVGQAIARIETGYNDPSLAVCETNIINSATLLHSNKVQVAMCTCFSTSRETNGSYLSGVGGFALLNTWILSNSNLFDRILRYDLNTNWGIAGSFTNNPQFYDPESGANLYVHLSGDAYRQMALIDIAGLTSPTNTPASTLTGGYSIFAFYPSNSWDLTLASYTNGMHTGDYKPLNSNGSPVTLWYSNAVLKVLYNKF